MSATNARFYNLPEAVVTQMEADREAAVCAAGFWAWPGEEWMWNFEETWLRQRGHVAAADKAARCAALTAA